MRSLDAAQARALSRLEAFLDRERPGWHEDDALAAQARAISEHYTERGVSGVDFAASHAYLAYFGPRAIAAVAHGFRASTRARSNEGTALDVGAGSGAASLFLLEAGFERVILIERSQAALARARSLLDDRAVFRPSLLEDAKPVPDAALLVCAFTYGELSGSAYEALSRLVPPSARMLIVDAGDHAHARKLQELRDVLRTGDRPILHPCPHHDICPALVRARDWCHERIDRNLTQKFSTFARLVGRDEAHMSVFALSLGAVGQERPAGEELLVIGDPRIEKGRVRLPVCGPRGLRFLQALKRNRGAHDALAGTPRGARLTVPRDFHGEAAHLTEPPK